MKKDANRIGKTTFYVDNPITGKPVYVHIPTSLYYKAFALAECNDTVEELIEKSVSHFLVYDTRIYVGVNDIDDVLFEMYNKSIREEV